jgi:uncharacterized membrane protein YcaP (DUF421 family)
MIDSQIWTHLIHPDIPLLEKVLRPIIIYFFLIVGFRLAGKRELAQLNPFDLIVLLTLSNTVQNAIIGADNSVVGGIVGASTLLGVNYFTVRFLYHHKRIDKLVEGDAIVLIRNGKLLEDRLHQELITREELEAAARRQGFKNLHEIDYAVLEAGGTLSCIGKASPDGRRHDILIEKLNEIARDVRALSNRRDA